MKQQLAKNPLILRFHRLMDVFTKSDDERDFYLDKIEGFLIHVNQDKSEEELKALEDEIAKNHDRYCIIPKMTFFEVKKFMENFINEKVYDIDTKEKLLDIISSKEPRENFLEYIYDNLTELEKWQQYFQERSRIRIIEWLRSQNIQFVFEEDLEINKNMIEKLKRLLFEPKVPKDVAQARAGLISKAKSYYSNEALNPRPKRGRPPKQVAKIEIEPEFALDIYTTVPPQARLFLYIPDIVTAASVTFSSKFESEEQLLASLRGATRVKVDEKLEALSQRLESLRYMTDRLAVSETPSELNLTESLAKKFPEKTGALIGKAGKEREKEKISSAIEEVLPKKGGKIAKEEGKPEEFIAEKRKRFAIKQVTPIKMARKTKKKKP